MDLPRLLLPHPHPSLSVLPISSRISIGRILSRLHPECRLHHLCPLTLKSILRLKDSGLIDGLAVREAGIGLNLPRLLRLVVDTRESPVLLIFQALRLGVHLDGLGCSVRVS